MRDNSMKRITKLIAGILILAMVVSCFPFTVFAASDSDDSNGKSRSLSDFYLTDGGVSHQYGYTGWTSLAAA